MRTAKTDQIDVSLRWAHSHVVGFVMSRLKSFPCFGTKTASEVVQIILEFVFGVRGWGSGGGENKRSRFRCLFMTLFTTNSCRSPAEHAGSVAELSTLVDSSADR